VLENTETFHISFVH